MVRFRPPAQAQAQSSSDYQCNRSISHSWSWIDHQRSVKFDFGKAWVEGAIAREAGDLLHWDLSINKSVSFGLCLGRGSAKVQAILSMAAISVAWTFMSEILTTHDRIIGRLSRSNNQCFDRVSWPCDGHEWPSYIRSLRHRTQELHLFATCFQK
jgi:hypothetical protein